MTTSTFHLSTTVAMKPVDTSAQTVPLQTLAEILEELAEKWPIILKNCSMLGDTYNAQKNASIIYLGLLLKFLTLTLMYSVSVSPVTRPCPELGRC